MLGWSSAGGTAGTALHDIGRIARLHTFLARFNLLAAAQRSGDSARSAPLDMGKAPRLSGQTPLLSHRHGWEVPGSGRVALAAVGPLVAALEVFGAGAGGARQPGRAREDAAVMKQVSTFVRSLKILGKLPLVGGISSAGDGDQTTPASHWWSFQL